MAIERAALLALLLAAPAGAWAPGSENTSALDPSGVSTLSGGGASGGVAAGWQFQSRRRRSVQASGAVLAGVVLAAAAIGARRR